MAESRVISEVDVTDRAAAKGWQLDGVRVLARLLEDENQENPRKAGDVYNADVDEADYKHPTRGFCRHCGQWMHTLTQDEANAYNQALADDAPPELTADAGHWLPNGGTIICPARDGEGGDEVHQLDDPVAVRMWSADEWAFGVVEVVAVDESGHEWGGDSLAGVEYGNFPYQIDAETGVVSCRNIDPLNDLHHPVPEMIDQALGEAAEALAKKRPTIVAPAAIEEGTRA